MNVEELRKRWYTEDTLSNDPAFLRLIHDSVWPDSRVLDAGAGAGEMFPYDLKSKVREIVGVDLDPRVVSNPQLHRGIRASLEEIPVEDSSFDVVFCRYVIEHVEDPARFLAEVYRVLKPGGMFLFLTPNKWHYVSIGSRITPQRFHVWYNRKRGREDEDTFPTTYPLNTAKDIRKHLKDAGFEERDLIFRENCPNYLTLVDGDFFARSRLRTHRQLNLRPVRAASAATSSGGLRRKPPETRSVDAVECQDTMECVPPMQGPGRTRSAPRRDCQNPNGPARDPHTHPRSKRAVSQDAQRGNSSAPASPPRGRLRAPEASIGPGSRSRRRPARSRQAPCGRAGRRSRRAVL